MEETLLQKSFAKLFDKTLKPFLIKYQKLLVSGSLLLIGLIWLFRSCNGGLDHNQTYVIERDIRWDFINIHGKEKNLTAFSDSLLLEIAQLEKLHFRLHFTPYNELLRRLENGDATAILSDLRPLIPNSHLFTFSEPYFFLGPVVVIRQNSSFKTPQDLENKIVGIQSGFTFLELKNLPFMQLRSYDNPLASLSALDDKKLDAVILPGITAYPYLKSFYNSRLKAFPISLLEEGIRLIALKNEEGEALVEAFNRGLQILKDNGTYQRLIEEWGLANTQPTK